MSKPITAWHFLQSDGRTSSYTNRQGVLVRAGMVQRVKPPIIPCEHGLHWSRRAIDALQYAPSAIVQRVRARGTVVEHDDKGASSVRETVWVADATNVLHEFACRCAEQALIYITEPAARKIAETAISTTRLWVQGKATDEELSAAWSAAERYFFWRAGERSL